MAAFEFFLIYRYITIKAGLTCGASLAAIIKVDFKCLSRCLEIGPRVSLPAESSRALVNPQQEQASEIEGKR